MPTKKRSGRLGDNRSESGGHSHEHSVTQTAGRCGRATRLTTARRDVAILTSVSTHEKLADGTALASALLFHHVGPPRSNTHPSLTVDPHRFQRYVETLKRRGFVGLSASDWANHRNTGQGLSNKDVILTFDDAYADLTTYALPTLVRLGFRATVFAVAGAIGGTNSWDE